MCKIYHRQKTKKLVSPNAPDSLSPTSIMLNMNKRKNHDVLQFLDEFVNNLDIYNWMRFLKAFESRSFNPAVDDCIIKSKFISEDK